MRAILLFIFLLVVCAVAAPAQPINGRISSASTPEALPFVNIGVVMEESFFRAVEMIKWVGETSASDQFAFSAALGYSDNQVYTRQTS